jgi:hypothetical protein
MYITCKSYVERRVRIVGDQHYSTIIVTYLVILIRYIYYWKRMLYLNKFTCFIGNLCDVFMLLYTMSWTLYCLNLLRH